MDTISAATSSTGRKRNLLAEFPEKNVLLYVLEFVPPEDILSMMKLKEFNDNNNCSNLCLSQYFCPRDGNRYRLQLFEAEDEQDKEGNNANRNDSERAAIIGTHGMEKVCHECHSCLGCHTIIPWIEREDFAMCDECHKYCCDKCGYGLAHDEKNLGSHHVRCANCQASLCLQQNNKNNPKWFQCHQCHQFECTSHQSATGTSCWDKLGCKKTKPGLCTQCNVVLRVRCGTFWCQSCEEFMCYCSAHRTERGAIGPQCNNCALQCDPNTYYQLYERR